MTKNDYRILSFATEVQAALFSEELVGQLSDGAWENASPADHWEAWSAATVVVDPANVGRDFTPRKDGYAFAAQLMDAVGGRMIEIGRKFDGAYNEKKLRADLFAISKTMKTFNADAGRAAFAEAYPEEETVIEEPTFEEVAAEAQDANDTADLVAEEIAVEAAPVAVASRPCHAPACDGFITRKSGLLCSDHEKQYRAGTFRLRAAKAAAQDA